MPLYEYRCNECSRRFSLLVGVTAEKVKLQCPKCGARRVTKLISRVARTPRSEDLDDFDGLGEEDLGEDLDSDEGLDDDFGDE